MFRTLMAACFVWGASASLLFAQQTPQTGAPQAAAEAPPTQAENDADEYTRLIGEAARDPSMFDFSFSPPQSIGMGLIGVANDQITRVQSTQNFAMGLAQAFGDDKGGAALAIDVSPYWALGNNASLEEYSQFRGLRLAAARAKASIAVAEGDEAGSVPSSVVLTVATGVLRSQDPLLSDTVRPAYVRCVNTTVIPIVDELERAIIAHMRENFPQTPEDAERQFDVAREAVRPRFRDRLSAAHEECAKQANTTVEEARALDIGAAVRFVGEPGSFESLDDGGWTGWVTYRTGAFGGAQAPRSRADRLARGIGLPRMRGVVHARYTWADAQYNGGVRLGDVDSGLVVAGVEGGDDETRWSLQAGWNRQDGLEGVQPSQEYRRYLGRYERRLQEGVWLVASVGQVEGRGVEDDSFATVGINVSATSTASSILRALGGGD